MTSAEIRQSFLDFFREKEHTIVPSSPLLPSAPNLLFTNAGMNQFVPIFLGQEKADVSRWPGATPGGSDTRAADTQKCIRAGGKHNDLDDVGLDTYHHTFFEMLGNWSFGDYFKKEAIEWAWELVVERWKLPAARVYATVYQPGPGDPSEFDQEAHDHWARLFTAAGLDPAVHIVNGNKKDNFWMMGDTGPCGPCSELHIDLTPAGDTRGSLVNAGDPRCIEIWNLVFIQFNANADGTFSPLPARHVDTGMGFERIASMIQGTKGFTDFSGIISNYDTDVFAPIFRKIEELSGNTSPRPFPPPAGATPSAAGASAPASEPAANVSTVASPVSAASSRGSDVSSQGSSVSASSSSVSSRASSGGGEPGGARGEPGGYGGTPRGARGEPGGYGGNPSGDGGELGGDGGALSPPTAAAGLDQVAVDVAFRVVADHIRTLCFSIADGILPSNTDRGYVLRRILRRAVRYGRQLGLGGRDTPSFLAELADAVLYAFGPVFPELMKNRERIRTTLATEEGAFMKTLDTGTKHFDDISTALVAFDAFRTRLDELGGVAAMTAEAHAFLLRNEGVPFQQLVARLQQLNPKWSLANADWIKGADAFKLYDTYGFPLDLTELMARERGLTVDTAGFEKLMEEQRARARAAQKKEVVAAEGNEPESTTETEFVGYEMDHCKARVVALQTRGEDTFALVDRSPLYAEMGGQVGDTGVLILKEQKIPVLNTVKRGGTFLLKLAAETDRGVAVATVETPQNAILQVDEPRRRAIESHHTATHLLHWALHEVVGPDAAQKGSYVGPDRLRFDFNSAALTPAQVADVERLVNEHALANEAVSWRELPFVEVRGRADIMQFFGDKYGDTVRVVQIGGEPGSLNGFSMELCAGTHVRATGQLGAFKIVSEGAIAAGVRRIEAVVGRAALEFFAKRDAELSGKVRELEARLLELNKAQEKERAAALKREAGALAAELLAKVEAGAAVPRLLEKISLGASGSAELLPALHDALKSRGFKGVAVLAGVGNEGSVPLLVAATTPELAAKFPAGKLLGQLAPLVGGKGGGKPDLARGAGKEPGKVDELLRRAGELLL